MLTACSKVDNLELTYSGQSITAKLCNCTSYVLGDLSHDALEYIMARREEVRQTFLTKHRIPDHCTEHCFDVWRLRQEGWKKERED